MVNTNLNARTRIGLLGLAAIGGVGLVRDERPEGWAEGEAEPTPAKAEHPRHLDGRPKKLTEAGCRAMDAAEEKRERKRQKRLRDMSPKETTEK